MTDTPPPNTPNEDEGKVPPPESFLERTVEETVFRSRWVLLPFISG